VLRLYGGCKLPTIPKGEEKGGNRTESPVFVVGGIRGPLTNRGGGVNRASELYNKSRRGKPRLVPGEEPDWEKCLRWTGSNAPSKKYQ